MTTARKPTPLRHQHPPGHFARDLPEARDFCPVPGCPLNPGQTLRVALPGPIRVVEEYQNVFIAGVWSWKRVMR